MSVDKKDLIMVRDMVPEDKNFIFSTWLRGLRYGNDFFELIESGAYYTHCHSAIEKTLANPGVVVKVACLKEDPNVVLGYSVYSGATLAWVQVKAAWRHIGIARSLVPDNILTVTNITKIGAAILKTRPHVRFNPFQT